MMLSPLQKYILLVCLNAKDFKINRAKLSTFYDNQKKKPQEKLMTKIITQSLERLINKELMIGYGMRTPHKWFIREIKLTRKGKEAAQKLLGEQKKLPFKNIKKQKILNSPVIARANLPAGRQAPGARRNLANSVASYGIATLRSQ